MAVYLPRPLEDAWRTVIERAARRPVDPRALALMVERVSRKYHGEDVVIAASDDLAARARFWLPRDLPKVSLAIAELLLARAIPERPLRVLDLGAGVGSTTLGLFRALAQVHDELRSLDEASMYEEGTAIRAPSVARVVAVDRDEPALRVLTTALAEARALGLLPEGPEVETVVGDYADSALLARGPFDLLLAGATLVEHTRDAGDEVARGAAIAERLDASARAAQLAPDGFAIVLEPASRPEARALQHARGPLFERGWSVFAPCTHAGPCPLLERERDWCHEDLATDLPEWLAPVARAAGLRWQGLTFSYLVLSRTSSSASRARSVNELVASALVPARALSAPRASKGKTELFVCAPYPRGGARWMELERDTKKLARDARTLGSHAKGDPLGVVREGKTAEEARAEGTPIEQPEHVFERPLRVKPDELVAWSPAR